MEKEVLTFPLLAASKESLKIKAFFWVLIYLFFKGDEVEGFKSRRNIQLPY